MITIPSLISSESIEPVGEFWRDGTCDRFGEPIRNDEALIDSLGDAKWLECMGIDRKESFSTLFEYDKIEKGLTFCNITMELVDYH